jgi:hypothetical protein
MPDEAAVPEPEASPAAVFRREGADLGIFLIRLSFDTARNLAILGALSTIFFAAKWLKEHGLDEESARRIQQLHFWLTYGALLWIGIAFLAKLLNRGLR